MSKRILVAGASGKTGRILTRDLVDQGHKVVALTRDSSDISVLPKAANLRHADLTHSWS
ncbi:NAD(P)H-binding protein [Tropicibacter oceani]|uniref:NAD(P)H-binding protein n=1 Tax=Tropicibacter oceani TaxID=3058420 RepID=A0ABY8QL09_9RHOB|nr:NAD(P)H-binding protein [Tropicibacter oceani]WGW04686.1 NAD(P)H-binding protein [Tropicibacter oceani]